MSWRRACERESLTRETALHVAQPRRSSTSVRCFATTPCCSARARRHAAHAATAVCVACAAQCAAAVSERARCSARRRRCAANPPPPPDLANLPRSADLCARRRWCRSSFSVSVATATLRVDAVQFAARM